MARENKRGKGGVRGYVGRGNRNADKMLLQIIGIEAKT